MTRHWPSYVPSLKSTPTKSASGGQLLDNAAHVFGKGDIGTCWWVGAVQDYGLPRIVNTDQGSQFTAEKFTRTVLQSEHGRQGAWRDNVFVERVHSSTGRRTPNEAYMALLKTVG